MNLFSNSNYPSEKDTFFLAAPFEILCMYLSSVPINIAKFEGEKIEIILVSNSGTCTEEFLHYIKTRPENLSIICFAFFLCMSSLIGGSPLTYYDFSELLPTVGTVHVEIRV